MSNPQTVIPDPKGIVITSATRNGAGFTLTELRSFEPDADGFRPSGYEQSRKDSNAATPVALDALRSLRIHMAYLAGILDNWQRHSLDIRDDDPEYWADLHERIEVNSVRWYSGADCDSVILSGIFITHSGGVVAINTPKVDVTGEGYVLGEQLRTDIQNFHYQMRLYASGNYAGRQLSLFEEIHKQPEAAAPDQSEVLRLKEPPRLLTAPKSEQDEPETDEVLEQSEYESIYEEGKQAFKRKVKKGDCPYHDSLRMQAWGRGWSDAKKGSKK